MTHSLVFLLPEITTNVSTSCPTPSLKPKTLWEATTNLLGSHASTSQVWGNPNWQSLEWMHHHPSSSFFWKILEGKLWTSTHLGGIKPLSLQRRSWIASPPCPSHPPYFLAPASLDHHPDKIPEDRCLSQGLPSKNLSLRQKCFNPRSQDN